MKIVYFLLILLSLATALSAGDISLTVYNNNRALVHEFREIDLQKGIFTYNFSEISAQIDPTTVRFKTEGVEILEQNFEFDLVSPEKIREKFLGDKIRLFFEDGSMLEGVLQPSMGGELIITGDDGSVKIIRSDQLYRYDFPAMPKNFVQKPTLVWLINSSSAGKRKSEVSYLTSGLSWHAEYVAVTGGKDLGFTGWVSIENKCGLTFEEAKLKLMAGELHMVEGEGKGRIRSFAAGEVNAPAPPQFAEEAFFEYHLYTLQRRSTVKNNEIKQISLFPEAKVKYTQDYIFDTGKGGEKIGVYLVFKNTQESGLGMALPAGKVRIYQQDEDGTLEFIGEDLIKHTPRDEKVTIQVGKAFDLVGEKRITDSRQLSRTEREEDVEISLRNHKDITVTITVRENLYGYWQIINKSHEYKKIDANTIEFKIQVPPHKPEEETLLKYTVRYTRK